MNKTIKEEMLARRESAKQQIGYELQREVNKVRNFAKELQEKNCASTKFSCNVYKSGEFCIEVENPNSEKENLCLDLKSDIGMPPQNFEQFLKEILKEEGVELTDKKFEISLL